MTTKTTKTKLLPGWEVRLAAKQKETRENLRCALRNAISYGAASALEMIEGVCRAEAAREIAAFGYEAREWRILADSIKAVRP